MTDFSKILEQAKNLQSKMKESQDKIKEIKVEGISGGGSVKVMLNGNGEMIKLFISPEISCVLVGSILPTIIFTIITKS